MTRKVIIRLLRYAGLLGAATVLAKTCTHERIVRYWFKKHHFARVCKDRELVIETGRDKSHRYPEGAPGVVERGAQQRGARVEGAS